MIQSSRTSDSYRNGTSSFGATLEESESSMFTINSLDEFFDAVAEMEDDISELHDAVEDKQDELARSKIADLRNHLSAIELFLDQHKG